MKREGHNRIVHCIFGSTVQDEMEQYAGSWCEEHCEGTDELSKINRSVYCSKKYEEVKKRKE